MPGSLRHVLDSPASREFRARVRDLCAERLPPDIRRKVLLNAELNKSDYVRWQTILHQAGWYAGHWPVAHGGHAWTPLQRFIFEEEAARYGAPWLTPFGIAYVGPVIYTFGSEAQKKKYLPAILTTETWWCQGYSEPGAGSDLASLATRAERDGDVYVVNGQKIWTTMAHWADMMFALVRTSSAHKRQEGISFLLIDMKTPGVTVRPIVSLEKRHHLNEVFLQDVRVPLENRVGDEGGGWTYSKFLLTQERLLAAELGKAKRRLDLLIHVLECCADGGMALRDHPVWRRRVAQFEVKVFSLECVCYELLAGGESGESSTDQASILKILGSELGQALTSALLAVAGHRGLGVGRDELPDLMRAEDWRDAQVAGIVRDHLSERASTIYGGTNEIQRNILSRTLEGLA